MTIANIKDVENEEIMFFLNSGEFTFVLKNDVDYSPKIITMIRVMDTPKEDIIHHYLQYKLPPIMHTKVLGIV